MVGPCDEADMMTWHPPHAAALVAGGIPCQDHSTAGKRAGTAGARGALYVPFLRIAREAAAQVVLIENVRGIFSAPGAAGATAFGEVRAAVMAEGYHVVCALLDAAGYGVPQRRRRVFLAGFRSAAAASAFRWPAPTHDAPGGLLGLLPWVTVRQALGLGDGTFSTGRPAGVTTWQGMRSLDVDAPATTVAGRNNADKLSPLDQPSPTVTAREQCSALAFGSRGAVTGPPRAGDRINPALAVELAAAGVLDRPATTVDTREVLSRANRNGRAGDHARVSGVRLTLEQLAALQGFPPGFAFCGATAASRHRQVGNAVPPPLAEAVGRAVLLALITGAAAMAA
jgi:DNA (cytosine-5)-methyltransferase 1